MECRSATSISAGRPEWKKAESPPPPETWVGGSFLVVLGVQLVAGQIKKCAPKIPVRAPITLLARGIARGNEGQVRPSKAKKANRAEKALGGPWFPFQPTLRRIQKRTHPNKALEVGGSLQVG